MSVSHSVLSAVFSDESPAYRFPSEPNPGDTVMIRIRVEKGSAQRIILLTDSLTVGSLMIKSDSDEFFDSDLQQGGSDLPLPDRVHRRLKDCL